MLAADVEALIIADAIGALDADERDALDMRLCALTPTEYAQIAELYDVAVVIAESITQVHPPSQVRARLLIGVRSGDAVRARTAPPDTE